MVGEKVLVLGTLGREVVHAKGKSSGMCFGGTAYHSSRAFRLLEGVSPVIVSIIGTDIEIGDLVEELAIASTELELQKCEDKPSFFWEARYDNGSSSAQTISLENRLLSQFSIDWQNLALKYPMLRFSYLAAFNPDQQARCATAFKNSFVVSETLDYWIQVDRKAVLHVIEQSNGVVLTENEVRILLQVDPLPDAQSKEIMAFMSKFSLDFLTVTFDKRGSHTYHREGSFFQPALSCDEIDPTGAGNVFTSSITGFLASNGPISAGVLSQAVALGSVLASFQVRAFGSLALDTLDMAEVEILTRRLASRVSHYPK